MRWAGPVKGAAAALGLLALGATPGDIGGCGQPPEELDGPVFFEVLGQVDCQRCEECGLSTKTCTRSCKGEPGLAPKLPEGCVPLAHDGEVCLRRLRQDSCDDYKAYVADDEAGEAVALTQRPRPSECQFCPVKEQ